MLLRRRCELPSCREPRAESGDPAGGEERAEPKHGGLSGESQERRVGWRIIDSGRFSRWSSRRGLFEISLALDVPRDVGRGCGRAAPTFGRRREWRYGGLSTAAVGSGSGEDEGEGGSVVMGQ